MAIDERPAGVLPEVWEDLDDVMASVPVQGDVLRLVDERVGPQVAQLFGDGAPGVERVYLVGCGDSYFAAYAAQLFVERLTGIDTCAMESMEFSRYKAPFLKPGSLVIPISNGGGVMRTVEAAELAMEAGGRVTLITARPDSAFGRVGAPLVNQYAEVPGGSQQINAIGLVNYMASFLSLSAIAIQIGEARGRVTHGEADHERQRVRSVLDQLRPAFEGNVTRIREFVRETAPLRSLFILGAGPSYGAAMFAAAKFYEAPNINAVAQELEDWAHEQFFTLRSGQLVMVIAPRGLSGARPVEILEGIRAVGATSIVVSDDAAALELATIPFPMPSVGEDLAPLADVVPAEILAIAYLERQGKLDMPDASLRDLQHTISHRQIGQSARVSLAQLNGLDGTGPRRP